MNLHFYYCEIISLSELFSYVFIVGNKVVVYIENVQKPTKQLLHLISEPEQGRRMQVNVQTSIVFYILAANNRKMNGNKPTYSSVKERTALRNPFSKFSILEAAKPSSETQTADRPAVLVDWRPTSVRMTGEITRATVFPQAQFVRHCQHRAADILLYLSPLSVPCDGSFSRLKDTEADLQCLVCTSKRWSHSPRPSVFLPGHQVCSLKFASLRPKDYILTGICFTFRS